MEIKFDNSGLRDLEKRINDLDRKQKENGGSVEVSFAELFNDKFLQEYTSFQTLDELFVKSGFKIESQEDFKSIPDDEWDVFIKENTKFSSWEEMYLEAGTEYAARQLGF